MKKIAEGGLGFLLMGISLELCNHAMRKMADVNYAVRKSNLLIASQKRYCIHDRNNIEAINYSTKQSR